MSRHQAWSEPPGARPESHRRTIGGKSPGRIPIRTRKVAGSRFGKNPGLDKILVDIPTRGVPTAHSLELLDLNRQRRVFLITSTERCVQSRITAAGVRSPCPTEVTHKIVFVASFNELAAACFRFDRSCSVRFSSRQRRAFSARRSASSSRSLHGLPYFLIQSYRLLLVMPRHYLTFNTG